MSDLEVNMRLPDVWQQQAIRALQEGKDVVVDAPTGAGKTYIFELLVEKGHLKSNAVYTVPTRALANDKLRDWRQRGWNAGIVTGDIAENLDAPVVVATLETQKYQFLRGDGPGLLVIDEFQMLGDQNRGVNYELTVALAPEHTQLLLMSGSVGNPQSVVDWLQRLGRRVDLIRTHTRPVPLDEIDADGMRAKIPASVQGFWPRIIAKAMKYEMAPLLAFAPRRRAAEKLAMELAQMLPEEDPLILTSEQRRLAGDTLARLLRARIAFHHSGLDYAQRAGLVEPLAKAGQLRVVVATMGLSSGINFSMRSVIVTDREYRSGELAHHVRPDELLQMFGRAGRRGLDKKGYIIVAAGKPRFTEARPLNLKRSNQIDWPSLIAVMEAARRAGKDPMQSARAVADCLFSRQRISLGLSDFAPDPVSRQKARAPTRLQKLDEFQNPDGSWERLHAAQRRRLDETLIYDRERWRPALKVPASIATVEAGNLCRLGEGSAYMFGREVPVARFGRDENEGDLVLTRWASRALQKWRLQNKVNKSLQRARWTLEALESELIPALPFLTQGGRLHDWRERHQMLYARLDYQEAEVFATIDSSGRALLGAPRRTVEQVVELSYQSDAAVPRGHGSTPADAWYSLGLIDEQANPTRRGLIFSFFNHGEGLAIAAALEEPAYPIEDLILDLANLRAGHRFSEFESYSSRFRSICRQTYGEANYPGYLLKGVPENYGDGATEILFGGGSSRKAKHHGEELLSGDIERARVEWRSLLHHIDNAPDVDWDRWDELKTAAAQRLAELPRSTNFDDLPPLTHLQSRRHKSFLRFD